jgi:hypothetical protein
MTAILSNCAVAPWSAMFAIQSALILKSSIKIILNGFVQIERCHVHFSYLMWKNNSMT